MTLQQAAERLFPRSRVREFAPYWTSVESYADLTTPQRKAMFLAQIGHESGNLKAFEEDLNYSAGRLRAVWPSRFGPGKANPVDYDYNPEKLANLVYGGRMGNTVTGDGWKYHGRGLIMLTGKYNYHAATQGVGDRFGVDFVRNPELVAQPKYALYVAAWYWNDRNINPLVDRNRPEDVTRKINGGTIGHSQRMTLYHQALDLLT